MPILPALPEQNVKQLYMPSTLKQADGTDTPLEEQAWVKMDISPLNVQDFLAVEDAETMTKRGLGVFAERIKEWNYTEADGTAVPINGDTIVRLPIPDLTFLAQQLPQTDGVQLTVDQKKS